MIREGSTDESSSHRLHLPVSRTVKGRPDGNRGDDKACSGASASGIGHSKALWQLGDLRRAGTRAGRREVRVAATSRVPADTPGHRQKGMGRPLVTAPLGSTFPARSLLGRVHVGGMPKGHRSSHRQGGSLCVVCESCCFFSLSPSALKPVFSSPSLWAVADMAGIVITTTGVAKRTL
jgi:hypothetical protein